MVLSVLPYFAFLCVFATWRETNLFGTGGSRQDAKAQSIAKPVRHLLYLQVCQFPLEHLFCLVNCKSREEEVSVCCLPPTANCILSYGASYHTDSWRRHRPRNHLGRNSHHQSCRCSDRVGRAPRRPGRAG